MVQIFRGQSQESTSSSLLSSSSSSPARGDAAVFKFTFSTQLPPLKLCFDCPPFTIPASPSRPFKRRRALSDVDGAGGCGSGGRKKRRLRLHLITSRLSRPFSQPASNIVNRGISKIAIWGASRTRSAAGGGGARSMLRKAAIMNRVRMRINAVKDVMRLEMERSRGQQQMALREIVIQKPFPRLHDFPLPPSPLGLSNYDALDLEDEVDLDDEVHDGIERISSIYSDFNIMNPVTSDGDDYDYLDALDGITPLDLPDTPPAPPEESIAELFREKEGHGASFFVELKG